MKLEYEILRVLKPEIEVEIKERNGRIVKRETIQGKCFVKNFAEYLRGILARIGVTLTDTSGTQVSEAMGYEERHQPAYTTTYAKILNANAGDGKSEYGIVVGKGTTPPTVNDYKLEDQIPHGDGDNQLHYTASTVKDVEVNTGVSPPIISVTIERSFVNNGSIDVDVNEIGLIILHGDYAETRYYLIIRDVISTQTVSPGQSMVVRFKFKVQGKFVKNFIDFIHHGLKEVNESVIDTGGSSKRITMGETHYHVTGYFVTYYPGYSDADTDDDSYGIWAGNSDTPYAYDQYSLASRFDNSTLKHYKGMVLELVEETDKFKIPLRRAFENVTNSVQTIKEIGIVIWNKFWCENCGTLNDTKFMIFRDVISPKDLNPGDVISITVYITILK